MTIRKTFDTKVLDKRKDGGRILINTASIDRDKDRVFPQGAKIDNYLKNPVVQWGHDYRSPFATIGKTNSLSISPEGIVADFTLRPAANDQDPQNVILLLWNGDWVRTSSIGFIPTAGKPNDVGGTDFTEWELLEWSIVPIPANQDALRLAVKAFDPGNADDGFANAAARVITDKSLTDAERDTTLKELDKWRGTFAMNGASLDSAHTTRSAQDEINKSKKENGAWIRRLKIESDLGEQTLFGCFREYALDVPADATVLQFNWATGECTEVPSPDAGKTVTFKDALFVPPLAFVGEGFDEDSVYGLSARTKPDEEMITAPDGQWKIVELGEIIDQLPAQKQFSQRMRQPGFGIDTLTRHGIENARKAVRAQMKRGRVLSAKNEEKIIVARDNLNDVLAQLDEQPADAPEQNEFDPEQEKELLAGLKHITTLVKEVIS